MPPSIQKLWGTRRHTRYNFHFRISQNDPELPLTSKNLFKVYPGDKIDIKASQKKEEKRGREMRNRKEKRESKKKKKKETRQEKETEFVRC